MFVLQLQAWFLRPEEEAIQARGFLKALVVKTPETAIFAFTGSSMCSVWVNVAAMTPNGISMLVHNAQCHLPAAVSAAASAESWQFLQTSCPGVPADLTHYISQSLPAMQVYVTREYVNQTRQPSTEADLLAFVQKVEVMTCKLLLEVRACICLVLSLVVRRAIHSTLSPRSGIKCADCAGLQRFLNHPAQLSPSQRLVLLHPVSDDVSLGRPDRGIAELMAPYMEILDVDASRNKTMRLEVPCRYPALACPSDQGVG